MTTPEMASVATARIGIVKSLALLAVGLLPWPSDWDKVRDVVDSAPLSRAEPRRARGHAAGYYEGLIGGREGSDSSRGDASQRLIGKPERLGPLQGSGRRSLSSTASSFSSSSSHR